MGINGRTAIVTGGNKGVGRGIVYSLVRAGANVCICYNSSADYAEETLAKANEIAENHAFLYKCDVSVRGNVRSMVSEAVNRFGKIDILVNNAALQPNLPVGSYDTETFNKVWNINIGGYFLCVQECLPYLKKSECPRIINVSSVHGKRPAVFDVGYTMTKSAIKMFTREAAIELAKYKITVNSINLGACKIEAKTGNFKWQTYTPEKTRVKSSFPLGRTSTPKDVGDLIVYLSGKESEIITGSGIRIDGGGILL